MATYAEFSSAFDQTEFNHGTIITSAVSGSLVPAGSISTLMTTYAEFSSAFDRAEFNHGTIIASAISGALVPTGSVSTLMTYLQSVSGELDLSGVLAAGNPAWLIIDDLLRWMGEWSANITYDPDDVVLYKATADPEWHVFISKASHNVDNNPDSSAAWWRRVYQEPRL